MKNNFPWNNNLGSYDSPSNGQKNIFKVQK